MYLYLSTETGVSGKQQKGQQKHPFAQTVAENALESVLSELLILLGGLVDNLYKKSGSNVTDICILTCRCPRTSLEHEGEE